MKVININLDKMRKELENSNKNEQTSKIASINENLSQYVSNEPISSSILSQLSPLQKEEILKIRYEGSERRKFLLDQVFFKIFISLDMKNQRQCTK